MITQIKTKDVRLADSLNVGINLWKAKQADEALEYFEKMRPMLDDAEPLERAKFHNNFGLVWKLKAEISGDLGFLDKTLIEYEACKSFLEETNDPPAVGMVEANIANVLLMAGRVEQAHYHLNRAEALFIAHSEEIYLAQALETRARCFMAEKDYRAAAIAINKSEGILLQGVEKDPLTETLKTKRIVGLALEAQICLEYQNNTVAAEGFGITTHGVRKKIKEYFGSD